MASTRVKCTTSDSSFTPLLRFIQHADIPTLWLADENALSTLAAFESFDSKHLHIATNRYDIYQLALVKNISVEFNDFTLEELPQTPRRIIYRISKEKALTHYLFNRAAELLGDTGELMISGKKQEGVKTYASKLITTMGAEGKLKKSNSGYHGCFTQLSRTEPLDDQDYTEIQALKLSPALNLTPDTTQPDRNPIYSKPGVFGWNKIDRGTELLLQTLPNIVEHYKPSTKKILDLGCGYGWLFLNLPSYCPENSLRHSQITATDNNAAAITCATKNAQLSDLTIRVIADDCAQQLKEKFSLILCNPPFHQGFSHDQNLTAKFLQQIQQHLEVAGIAVLVMNEFISLPKQQLALFQECTVYKKQQGFKIVILK
ncbi:MAG: 16S rRNA (guanine1207-N2)-methyltransferase [Kiritimatiellia bacterium]|jgi:16S rRNA (guanine1207-N2)-methyltransferase